jgi:hypothetical protein
MGGVETIEELIGTKDRALRIWRYSQLRKGWTVTIRIEHLDKAPAAWKACVEPIAAGVSPPG